MSRIAFSDALKAFRRQAHLHRDQWRAVVLCPHASMLEFAWDEAAQIIGASSMSGFEANRSTRVMTMPNGATIRFAIVTDQPETHLRLHGLTFTHIIWQAEAPANAITFAELYKRSDSLPPEALITHVCGWEG